VHLDEADGGFQRQQLGVVLAAQADADTARRQRGRVAVFHARSSSE
jgi:hypothetical protein